ncbi:AAA family ATPase [Anoxybacillus flavithermus]|uniref:Nuclease SbcCD subunit C n=1 Tax=Anoxybacillus flavithermus (strain DSM 21510 / WK1) TaxID=491915 RepID=B7GM49_ANOFW|nr:AAA family ATPase [Anoxybacillus flavithermus]ACJ34587.1 ATPase involved in DNA repair, SbcC [Anoxybacillus flavithermus WK1]
MKPIRLTIAGLHSFRQKETIDFEKLCEGGLFGIFGPTGSGKSSILDAMTLALYGNVERASNQTNGIMNHAENELFVSFTFELQNASGAKRYTVERAFKRADALRIRSVVSRLIEEGTERVVIADKTRLVDEQVKQLLGLEMKDFTRAVVLPQGKFAEFLSLKGSERRQMLQRLFHLERYGDELNKKLKHKLAEASAKLEAIKGEQAGLGDASKEQVEKQKQALAEKKEELERAKNKLRHIHEQYEKEKQLWQWQCEKEKVEHELNKWREQEEQMKQLAQTYERSKEAERLVPYMEQVERSAQEVVSWNKKASELTSQLQQVRMMYEQANKQYEQCRAKKNEEEPKALQKQEQLKQALQTLALMRSLEQQQAKLRASLREIEQQEQQALQMVETCTKEYTTWSAKQAELKKQWEEKKVDVHVKERLEQAYEIKKRIQLQQQQLEELEREKENKQKVYETLKQTYDEVMKQMKESEARFVATFRYVESLYHRVCEREKQVAVLIYQKKEEKKQMEAARLHDLAATLAERLRDGEACPVCGSTHHPNRAKGKEMASDEEAMERMEHSIQHGEQLMVAMQQMKMQVEQLAELMARQPLPQHVDVEKVKREVEETPLCSLQEAEVEQKALYQDYVECRERVRHYMEQWDEQKQKQQQYAYQMETIGQQIREWEEKCLEKRARVEEEKKMWHKTFSDVSFEQVDAMLSDLREREREAQQLQQRIEKSVIVLDDKRAELERWKETYQDMTKQKAQCMTEWNMYKQQYEQYKRTLPEEIDEERVQQQIVFMEQSLQRMKREEEEAYARWMNLQQQLQTLQADKQAAHVALQEAEKRKKEAAYALAEQLQTSSFTAVDDVRASRLDEQTKQQIAQRIQQYNDVLTKLQNEWQRLHEAMNGAVMTKQQWEETMYAYEQVKQQVDEHMRQLGSLEAIVADLETKHARFVQLQQERMQLEKVVGQYEELQKVLRGNSFVEFIAEEQLVHVTRYASERLGELTRQRYAIELDSEGGFVIRDDANGGVRRPVTTLSGGETFLTSLSLALALSAQIQLRGEYPLQFFFLDEGFGTLDQELLDVVMSALERLRADNMAIGVISHVQELHARMPKRLIVKPAEPSGKGTTVYLEVM